MAIADLTFPQCITLVSLARIVIRADGAISERETAAMQQLAVAVGPERFVAAIQAAQVEASTPEDARRCAAEVSDPQARQLLYRLLHSMAVSDGLSPAEAAELQWLAGLWELPVDPTSLVLPWGPPAAPRRGA